MVFKMSLVIVILTVALHQGAASDGDKYCAADSCPEGLTNIGCGCDASSYAAECNGKNPRKVKVDGDLKTLVLREHNLRRDILACGSANPHPPAARMAEVTWDSELELLAECNAVRCVYGHDQCRSTKQYPYAGQNIASILICGKTVLKPEEVIVLSVDVWFQEYKNATTEMTDHWPVKQPGGQIGHFTTMINDRVRTIGCSFIEYEEQRNTQICHKYNFICNYSYTNFVGEKTYTKNEEPAKNCVVRNDQYSCLCSTTEPPIPEF